MDNVRNIGSYTVIESKLTMKNLLVRQSMGSRAFHISVQTKDFGILESVVTQKDLAVAGLDGEIERVVCNFIEDRARCLLNVV